MGGGPDIHSDDFYGVLGVPKSATPDEIKRAYLTLVREYTPERAPEAFKRIREAYETLSDAAARDRYDARPNPRIEALVREAAEAMKTKDFPRAEQLYKQALLETPELNWVRNLLGICFLHQRRPREAVAQYERVLQQPTVDASMHANLAHAYAMMRRYDVAEREFRFAMALAGDRDFEYGLALIEMTVERGEVEAGDTLAQELIKGARKGSATASAYYSKRIELALRLNRRHTIPTLLLRMTQGLETEEEKRIAAGTLGSIGSRLLAGELFELAERVAKTAGRLQPEEPGFDALEYAGRLLHENDFDGVARLLRTHVSFAPGGAVQGLRPWIEQYVASHAVYKGMRPLSSPPSFFKFYGIGTTVIGERDYDDQTQTHVVTRYCTFFFIPLFPIANYRVRPTPTRLKYFLGRLPLRRAQKIHAAAAIAGVIAFWILLAQVGASSTPDDAPASDGAAQSVGDSMQTRYDGEMVDTTRSITPVRADMRLSFANLSSSATGDITVFPPLTGTGAYELQARSDSIRLTATTDVGTILFLARRGGDNGLSGTYGIVGPGIAKRFGTWQVRLVRGPPIPPRLNPW